MRLFIAINIPKEVKDYLWKLKEEFRGIGKFNFVPKKNYHLTLKFLGEVDKDKLCSIKQKLSEINFNSFETSLYKIGDFNQKVLYVNLNPREKLIELAKKIDEQLIEYPNDFRFNDHITLARIKSLKDEKRFGQLSKIDINHLGLRIISFELMKSELSKDGSKYSILESYPLR